MNALRKYDILNNHNDYESNISSTEAIKTDPFELGNYVKGLANVNHQRNLSDFTEELVSQYAKYSYDQYELSLDMLPDDEQNELARLYIESTNREVNECVYGDDFTMNSEFTCALLAMLQDNTPQSRENFAHATRQNVLIYYKESLDNLLAEACDNYLHAINNENGYFAHRDLEHGDIVWSR